MSLETSCDGLWVLQALCGVETLPAALRLAPYIPSMHRHLVTGGGLRKLDVYEDMVDAGVIDWAGRVDAPVADWMAVVGTPERSVVLTLRRPGPDGPVEVVMVVCRRAQWLAKIARSGDGILLDTVGSSPDPDMRHRMMAAELLAAIGEYEPTTSMQVVNLPAAEVEKTVAAPRTHEAMVLTAAADPEKSAIAVMVVVDHGQVSPRVLTVADTVYGRVLITAAPAVDGQVWVSAQAGTRTGIRAELLKLLR